MNIQPEFGGTAIINSKRFDDRLNTKLLLRRVPRTGWDCLHPLPGDTWGKTKWLCSCLLFNHMVEADNN